MAIGNPHHRRLPRDARHIIRRLLALGTTGHHRAGVLHAQVAALSYAVNRRESPHAALPADTDMNAPGQRVRLGVEVRELLHRLQQAKNLREQQALVREIRHAILRRIYIHMKRTAIRAAAAARADKAFRWVRKWVVIGGRRVARWVREVRPGVRGRPVRVVGGRKPATRTRSASQPRSSRALPDGGRDSRPSRPRASRERVGQ